MASSFNYIALLSIITIVLTVFYTWFLVTRNAFIKILGFSLLFSAMVYLMIFKHWVWGIVFGSSFVLGLIGYSVFKPKDTDPEEVDKDKVIVLEYTEKNGRRSHGKMRFVNPEGFLTYAGAGSGKTASVGKPLLSEFMRNQYAIFCYDAKENDFTNTAFKLKEDIGYQYPIYNANFANPSRGYRFNPIKASTIQEESYVEEYMGHFYVANCKNEKLIDWDLMALGLLKGVAFSMFKNFPQYFSFPHIVNFISHNNDDTIKAFIKLSYEAVGFAGAFIDSADSPKTRGSIKTTLKAVLGSFAANKKMCYVLSGDDFEFNLIDPEHPKAFFVSNNFDLRNQISPIVVMLFIIAFRGVKFGNQIPFAGFMDEATTFKIPNFEEYPSELREYLVCFILLTQSPSKIEKTYDSHSRSSLESNIPNQFIGNTQDDKALTIFEKKFSQKETVRESVTTREGVKSTTKSPTKENRYDKDFFQSLKKGEFVGRAKDANANEFHCRFKQYTGGKLSQPPMVKQVTDEDIENHYKQIIRDVTETIFKQS